MKEAHFFLAGASFLLGQGVGVTRLGNGHERLNSMNERLDSNIPTCKYVYTRMEACLNPLSVNHLHTLIVHTISVHTLEPNLPHCEVRANLHAHPFTDDRWHIYKIDRYRCIDCKMKWCVICLHLQNCDLFAFAGRSNEGSEDGGMYKRGIFKGLQSRYMCLIKCKGAKVFMNLRPGINYISW